MAHRSPQVMDSVRRYFHRQMDRFAAANQRRDAAFKDAEQKKAALLEPDGDRPASDMAAQMGKPLMGLEVKNRLKRLNTNLYFERSPLTGMDGIYFYPGIGERRYLFCMEAEFTPEFSVRITHSETGKFKEFRGYRTVLARLIKQGYITEAGAEKEFGLPSRSSQRWGKSLGKLSSAR